MSHIWKNSNEFHMTSQIGNLEIVNKIFKQSSHFNSKQDLQRNRLENLPQYLPNHLTSPLNTCKVLVVGAGGIGCELLKNLVMGGFRDIEIVDLDTIDVSNLNRQFLFQSKHVSQPKAHVARSAALKFNNKVKILSRQADIKDSKFDLNYFKNFKLVLNALDNMDARRHVNKMCLQANVPLIESGSAGYLGQVTLIKKGFSECYDCQPKQPPKTYPICTIRSTPSLPIHCIVWAKSYLFNQLFGDDSDEKVNVIDMNQNAENFEEIKKLQSEAQALKRLRESMEQTDFAKNVFNKVFKNDIMRLTQISEMWKNREPPKPLDLESIFEADTQVNGEVNNKTDKDKLDSMQNVLPLKDTAEIFLTSTKQLANRLIQLKESNPDEFLEFDKDDELIMTFVAATSNLRAHIYGIEKKSQFEAKAMAGNIIPAIATTNAIIAGLIVIQAYKVLMGQLDKCKTTFVVPGGKRKHLFINEPLAPPNPDCYVCSVSHYSLTVDTTHFTLKMLRDRLSNRYQEILGNEFDSDVFQEISVSEGSRLLLDPDFQDNLGNSFESLGLFDGSTIQVSFEHPKLKTLNFIVSHTELFSSLNKQDMIQRIKCPEHDESTQTQVNDQSNGSTIQVEDDDDLVLLDDDSTTNSVVQEPVNGTRKRPISPSSINSPKVQKTED